MTKQKSLHKIFKKYQRYFPALFLVLVLAAVFSLSGFDIKITRDVNTASAATYNIAGYAWSNGIGWISFNCANTGICATSDYGVNVNPSTGNFSGYAWSSTVGWISFSETTGCPEAGCTTQPHLDHLTGATTGWAKALSSTTGWNGWIKLAGNISGGGTYGAVLSPTNSFSGYSWGGDVVGWISWNCSNAGSCASSNYGVTTSDNTLVNRAPVPVMASPASPVINTYTNQQVLFDATGSYDPDQGGGITNYEWRQGNCSTGTLLSSSISFSKNFAPAGTYVVYLRVKDNSGIWSTTCPSVTLNVSVPNPLDGVCGPANGVSIAISPPSGLCSVGSASAVTGSGPWNWTCGGQYGGQDASCSAPNSCGNAVCESAKYENPNTCRSDCQVNVREF